jgi:hypothetical protein
MSFIGTLWIPILLSSVFVFVASSLIHMLLGYHKSDFKKLADEDGVMESLRKFAIPAGDYLFPCPGSAKEMKSQEFLDKMTRGPVVMMTVMKSGSPSMTKNLVQWFIYILVVGIFSAYIGDRAVGAGGQYLDVFRFVGCTAFMGYSLALLQNSIWYHRNWCATIKSMFDGLIYALLTAGTFGWLWPR